MQFNQAFLIVNFKLLILSDFCFLLYFSFSDLISEGDFLYIFYKGNRLMLTRQKLELLGEIRIGIARLNSAVKVSFNDI